MAQKLESWMHLKVAQDVAARKGGGSTLEVGSGSLNHLVYEPSSEPYDVVEPFLELSTGSPFEKRIRHAYKDLAEIRDTQYDRILSIAAFEHITDLPSIVARCGTLLAGNGRLRVAIPSEGALLWGLGWRLTTGVEFWLRHRLNYGTLMRHEHVNSAEEIAGVLRIFFREVQREVYGISPFLSFYQFFACASPDRQRCADYLTRERTM
jgi:hypothetical protein